MNETAFDKSRLVRRDHEIEVRVEMRGNDFRDDFVDDVIETNGTKMEDV